ncbi:UNVERIFIED_CONTAM: ECF transporter S component [Streptococcus canis]|uniref:ECF transporter S component n=1 Tax=Streptococcus canis TaxID=1329 RepID=A0AAE4Q6B6_STRCB|nr:ECF transporter S component [Streptococcus canis]MDV5975956.1 ECF transporter S component [Streptococcus canis]
MTSQKLAHHIELSLYAALIFVSVQLLRIPVGIQFIHLGNALVVVAVLLYGSKSAALVASLGLGIFDLLNGYASVVWITILESLLICFLLHFIYEKGMQSSKKSQAIIAVGVVAALAKLLINITKYILFGYFGAQLPFQAALLAALGKVGGSFGTTLLTMIAVPFIYPALKRLRERLN